MAMHGWLAMLLSVIVATKISNFESQHPGYLLGILFLFSFFSFAKEAISKGFHFIFYAIPSRSLENRFPQNP